MSLKQSALQFKKKYLADNSHANSNYFGLIKKLIQLRNNFQKEHSSYIFWQAQLQEIYQLVRDEILNTIIPPVSPVKFGTSGWRGIIGKDINLLSISQVTEAIVDLYATDKSAISFWQALGVNSKDEARERGCILGYDNRFGNELLARRISDILTSNGFKVYFAGESTTGTLSATLLELKAAFSINLTPSHNPLEFGGCKFNAADGGPAATILTDRITTRAREIIKTGMAIKINKNDALKRDVSALDYWFSLVRKNQKKHKLAYDQIIADFMERDDLIVILDAVHGASRVHLQKIFKDFHSKRLSFLRTEADPTFGGIAPEPSVANLQLIESKLANYQSPLKIGIIMDPDADRIRFTDGTCQIDMNQFGAMAYHFLHNIKKVDGLVAKTVATSNFANAIAMAINEEVFEPRVGFKEFKPVIDRAVVCFEESDGITILGHTPEKDAYIGILLALDMVMTLNMNLGEYLYNLQEEFGYYFPAKDGVTVSKSGEELTNTLKALDMYKIGDSLMVGGNSKTIEKTINIDGHKFIFADKSWLMIRPSGTEAKVRFYVEARNESQKENLINTAKSILADLGVI